MGTIAALVTDLFEDSEYVTPAEAFARAGHRVVTVGLQEGRTVKGKNAETPVRVEKALDRVSVSDFDALFIPGGYSPDKLRADDRAVAFVRDFVNSGKPVFTICHAPQLLITADVLKGRTIKGWKSIRKDIENAGAAFQDREVVEDGNLVSSRSPQDLPAFVRASLARLA